MSGICYLCGSSARHVREGLVRDKPELPIWECDSCGLVYLGEIEQRDSDFYAESGMHAGNAPDSQAWLRDAERDDHRRAKFLAQKLTGRSVLDFGCGAGGFLSQIRELAARLATKSSELIVEVPASSDALLTMYGSRSFSEFTYWSCHLYLYTLALLGEQAGFRVNFIRQVQRYPLSNHLHWLAKNRPGGHQAWSFIDTIELDRAYESSLAALGLCDTLIASFSPV